MLRTDKPIYKVILVFNLILIVASVVFGVINLSGDTNTFTRVLTTIVRLLASLFAGFYIISGYRKNAAKYLKVFGILYMITVVTGIISSIFNTISTLNLICDVLIIVGILILTFIKDLGKTKSFVICGILVILQIVCTILVYLEGDPTIVKISAFMNIDLACLFGIMTYAKYLDKAERGTK